MIKADTNSALVLQGYILGCAARSPDPDTKKALNKLDAMFAKFTGLTPGLSNPGDYIDSQEMKTISAPKE